MVLRCIYRTKAYFRGTHSVGQRFASDYWVEYVAYPWATVRVCIQEPIKVRYQLAVARSGPYREVVLHGKHLDLFGMGTVRSVFERSIQAPPPPPSTLEEST